MSKEKDYLKKIASQLNAKEPEKLLGTLKEIRRTGHAYILPLIFEMLNRQDNQAVEDEVFQILSQLKEEDCVPYIVDEIKSGNSAGKITRLLASCWQSGLNYSKHLSLFAQQFVLGDYVTSIEAFTVIEEWIHDSSKEEITNCTKYLKDSIKEISTDKKPLYMELVKLVESHI